MNKINYDRMCMAVIRQQTAAGRVPTLLLHSCCALFQRHAGVAVAVFSDHGLLL